MPDFDVELRSDLSRLNRNAFTTAQVGEAREFAAGFGDPAWRTAEAADSLAEALLAAAYPFKVQMHLHRLKKGDLRAERTSLSEALEKAHKMLLSASADLSRIARIEDVALRAADEIKVILSALSAAEPALDAAPGRQSDRVFGRLLASALVLHLSAVYQQHGFATRIGKRNSLPLGFFESVMAIGDALGVHRKEKTWRNIASRSGHS